MLHKISFTREHLTYHVTPQTLPEIVLTCNKTIKSDSGVKHKPRASNPTLQIKSCRAHKAPKGLRCVRCLETFVTHW